MPVRVMHFSLVQIVAYDGRAAAELRHFPAQGHGVAVTVEKGNPIGMRGDSCKNTEAGESPELCIPPPTNQPALESQGKQRHRQQS